MCPQSPSSDNPTGDAGDCAALRAEEATIGSRADLYLPMQVIVGFQDNHKHHRPHSTQEYVSRTDYRSAPPSRQAARFAERPTSQGIVLALKRR